MTLDEAIEHCRDVASICGKCADEHAQLAEWLMELRKRRESDEIIAAFRLYPNEHDVDADPNEWEYRNERIY